MLVGCVDWSSCESRSCSDCSTQMGFSTATAFDEACVGRQTMLIESKQVAWDARDDGDSESTELPSECLLEEFEMQVTKRSAEESLGLEIFDRKRVIVVKGILQGSLLDRWNMKNPSRQLRPGSMICSVNGISTGSEEMVAVCVVAKTLRFKVARWKRYTVTVPVQKAVLGIEIDPVSRKVVDFTLPTNSRQAQDISLIGWNKHCEPGLEIVLGDEIIELNGRSFTYDYNKSRVLERCHDGPLSLVMERS